MVGEIARHDLRERVAAGEGGAEDHAGIVAQGVRQAPAIGQLRAFGRRLVAHDQRDTGVAQGVDAGGNGQAGNPVEGSQVLGGNAEFLSRSKAPPRPASLMTSATSSMDSKRRLSLVALHQARDVLVEHGATELAGIRSMN